MERSAPFRSALGRALARTIYMVVTVFASSIAAQPQATQQLGTTPPPSAVTRGAESEPDFTGFGVFLDQDFFFVAESDRNYTLGVLLQMSGRSVEWAAVPLAALDNAIGVRQIHEGLLRAGGERRRSVATSGHVLRLGGTGFTPEDLTLDKPDRTDRPYASLLFLETEHLTVNVKTREVFSSALALGVLGLRFGGDLQTLVHTIGLSYDPYFRPLPEGWHNQVSNGGELTALYRGTYQRELLRSWVYDVALQTELNAGWYMNAAIGGQIRVGWLESDFWQTFANPLGAGNGILGITEDRPWWRTPWFPEAYFFAAARARFIGYNALMQGQFRKSAYTLRPDQIERFVGEAEFGVSAGWLGANITAVLFALRTPEHLLEQRRSHAWGGLYLTWYLPTLPCN